MVIKLLLFFAAVLTAVHGDAVALSSRDGRFNTYYLFTRAYEDAARPITMPTFQELEDDSDNELVPELNILLDTIVIVHGHGGDGFTTLNPAVKNAYFDEDVRADIDVNVIVVDWSDFTKLSYSAASAAVQSVGKALGEYLQLLISNERINLNQIHLIGFNLGAHVVGYAGRELGGLVPRITGLDPAGNQWGSNSLRLRKSDARYVEVIHTDGDGLLSNGIGTAIGHVDFFVNGGGNQPGCISHACCHRRAYELFAATLIRKEPLYGFACNNNLQLTLNLCKSLPRLPVGGDSLVKPHGEQNVYRVNTGRTFPF